MQSYWDLRYGGSSSDTYEWYLPWATLRDDILPHLHGVHEPPVHKHAPPSAAASLTLQQIRKGQLKPGHSAASSATVAATAAPSPAASVEGSAAASSAAGSATTAASSSDAVVAAAPSCQRCLSSRILIAGCGNSELSAHMWTDGFRGLVSVDYSGVVVEKMRSLYAAEPTLADQFLVGDVRDLRSLAACRADGCVDAVIDKGTLDAILCGADSARNGGSMLAEMHRLLAPGGVLIVITYGQPSSRLPLLERKQFAWSVSHVPLGPTRFMYVCKKRGGPKPTSSVAAATGGS